MIRLSMYNRDKKLLTIMIPDPTDILFFGSIPPDGLGNNTTLTLKGFSGEIPVINTVEQIDSQIQAYRNGSARKNHRPVGTGNQRS